MDMSAGWNGFGIGGWLRGNDFTLMIYLSHHNEAPQSCFMSHWLQWSI